MSPLSKLSRHPSFWCGKETQKFFSPTPQKKGARFFSTSCVSFSTCRGSFRLYFHLNFSFFSNLVCVFVVPLASLHFLRAWCHWVCHSLGSNFGASCQNDSAGGQGCRKAKKKQNVKLLHECDMQPEAPRNLRPSLQKVSPRDTNLRTWGQSEPGSLKPPHNTCPFELETAV